MIYLQAPVVNTYAYPFAFDNPSAYRFLAQSDTFEIEDDLAARLPVLAGELYLPYIELRTDLLLDAVKDARVDTHKVRLDVAQRNDVEALPH